MFPLIPCEGTKVVASNFIEKGTSWEIIKGYVVSAFVGLFLALVTYGVALIALIFYPFIAWHQNRKALALIHGSGIKVTSGQFPEIYNAVQALSDRLQIDAPDVYIVESNILNAFAVRHGKKNVILLTDDIINACIVSDLPKAIGFILSHELAHIALGHNSMIRSFIRSKYKGLSRLDEYSADSVAYALTNNREDAISGMVLLVTGPHLVKFLNVKILLDQVSEVVANKYTVKAEKTLTHPMLLSRIHRLINK